MIKKSYAKINIAINVIEKLPNNYHKIDMVMTKINIFDKLYFSVFNEDKIVITCTNPFIPLDEKNFVFQVIQRIKDKYQIKKGVRVHIAKVVPMQAGLGGGSSNAACAVDAMNELFDLNMNMDEKINLVKDLGADIAFFFSKGMARVRGIGEIIEPFNSNLSDVYIILVKPAKGVSTKLAYENINLETCDHPNIDSVIDALKNNDYKKLISNMKNSIEQSAITIRPVIQDIIFELESLGVDKAMVSGSGSTVFALTRSKDIINKVKKAHIEKKNFVYITNLVGRGNE